MAVSSSSSAAAAPLSWWRMAVTYTLYLTVSVSSWLLVNSTFAVLSELVASTPEGSNIASELSLVLQLGNLAAFAFVALRSRLRVPYGVSIPLLLAVAVATSLGLALLWDVDLLGVSMPLLFCMALAGGVGASSVVVLLPWASHLPSLTSAVTTGMAFSGLVSSALAAAMFGSGMSLETFFLCNTAVLLVSCVAFAVVFVTRLGDPEPSSTAVYSSSTSSQSSTAIDAGAPATASHQEQQQHQPEQQQQQHSPAYLLDPENQRDNGVSFELPPPDHSGSSLRVLSLCFGAQVPRRVVASMVPRLVYQFVLNLMYYSVFAVLPYTVRDYTQQDLLDWMTIGGILTSAIVRFACSFSVLVHFYHLPYCAIQVLLFVVLIVQASIGGTWLPGAVVVLMFWALAGVSGYQNTLLYQELYMTLPFEHVERMSQLLGVSQQAGALCGALGTFLCVYIVTS